MKATLADVARKAGVSRGTVSSALNDKAGARRISPATVRRVRRAAEALGYVPDHGAQSLRRQRTNTVGLLIDVSIRHAYLVEVVTHLERQARDRGYYINIGMLHDEVDVAHYVRSFAANRCDAILAVSVTVTPDVDWQLKAVRKRGIPVALVYCGTHHDYDCVCPDLRASAVMAVEHLAGKGCRRVFCAGQDPRNEFNSEYLDGYRETLARYGLEYDPALVAPSPADFEYARGLWKWFLPHVAGCTGVLASNDDVALGLARGVRESGLRIPDDVRIVAQNNTYPVRIAEAPISSTQYDLDRAAELAVQILLERLSSGETGNASTFCLERLAPTLVERE